MRKPRIFIGMTEIAGYYTQLAKALRDKGYDVVFAESAAHPFQYAQSHYVQPWIVRLYERAMTFRIQTPRKKIVKKIFGVVLTWMLSFLLFGWAICKFDCFIFGFGSSFFWRNLDLPILKFLGKTIICNMAHGSEARPPYMDGFISNGGKLLPGQKLYRLTKFIRKRCRFIERYVDIVVVAPLTCHFFTTRCVNHFVIGLPFNINQDSTKELSAQSTCTRILHAPSHPPAKGTYRIHEAITSLKKKGHNIHFVEVIGQPNDVILKELSLCDFVVDQIYSDTPLAGLATEAAWFGRPAVVGGYGWDILRQYIPADRFPPSKICHPDTLEEAIEQLVLDKVYCRKLGEKARAFVQEKWSSQHVAECYIKMFDGMVPENWFLNPEEIIYVHGGGFLEDQVKKNVGDLIRAKGVKALQLSDKPLLERAFIQFAELEPDDFK